MIDAEKDQIVRQRETVEQLFANESLLNN